jgi:hypothetical protein
MSAPTPFEVVCALVEARLLIEAYEAGEPPPEFEDGWKDDLEARFDAAADTDPNNIFNLSTKQLEWLVQIREQEHAKRGRGRG